MVVLDDYSFLQEKKGVSDKLIWKWSEYKDSKCTALFHTVDGALAKNIALHNHTQLPTHTTVWTFISR